MCEKALEKGLAKDDEAIARQLLIGALYERAGRMCQPIMLGAPSLNPKLKEMRDRVLPDLEKILKHDRPVRAGPSADRPAPDARGGRCTACTGVGGPGDRVLDGRPQDAGRSVWCCAAGCRARPPTRWPISPGRGTRSRTIPTSGRPARRTILRHGDVAKAVSDFNSLMERDSDNMLTRLGVAEELIKAQQYDEALKHINRIIEKKPTALAYTLRSQLWTQQEKLDEAVKDLDEAAKLDPDDLGSGADACPAVSRGGTQ